jgi:hypothetical protein
MARMARGLGPVRQDYRAGRFRVCLVHWPSGRLQRQKSELRSPKKKGAPIHLLYRSETHAALLRFPGDHATAPRGFVSNWVTALH